MKNKKVLSILFLTIFLFASVLPASSETLHGKEWKKGRIDEVSERYIKINGWYYPVSKSLVIKDIYKETLVPEPKMLKGVEEVLFKMKGREITEIRIIKKRH